MFIPVRLLFLFIIVLNVIPIFAQVESMEKDFSNDNSEFVPRWAKSAIWYQIFPDRFRNGDPSNDPELEDQKGAWPYDQTSAWKIHPWKADWYELQPWEKENKKSTWYNITRRRYGGDLQGIIDKLDYLQQLGVNTLYLNPVFWAPSHHKYDGATYHHIDPNFGPDPEGDKRIISLEIPDDPATWKWTEADKLFLKLVEDIHKRGMRIILDGVFNHMGTNSFAFQDVLKNQQTSKFKNWFTIKSWDDPVNKTKFDYEGWFGVKDLPEIREDENGIVEGPKEYIFNSTKRWMAPNGNVTAGIDGWRLDVAFCVKHEFWKDWRKFVKSINPGAYLTAEVIDSAKVLKEYLRGDEFDAVMNYNFAFICSEFFVEKNNKLTATEFDKALAELRNAFDGGVSYVQQNLFDSHDTNRLLSHIVNRDLASYRNWPDYFQKSKAENKKYNVRKPNDYEIKIQKLMALFQMTYVGAPMIYYGDEVGMWGANDPCCRKPMLWDDINYDDEVYNADQSKREKADKVEVNKELLAYYSKLIEIRKKYLPLQLGNFNSFLTDDKNEVYAFERNYNGQKVIVVLNNSNNEKSVNLFPLEEDKYVDVLTGTEYNAEKQLHFMVKAKSGAILVKD